MKFRVKSQDLQKSINIVEKAVSPRSSLPVLENIFIETKEGQLKLRGNDLEIGIENTIPLENIEEEGSILIKAKTISSIVSKLDNQALDIHVSDSNTFFLKGQKVDFDILGTASGEYPTFPSIEQGVQLALSVEDLKDLIKHTIFSVSFDETKQFLNGILVKNEGDKLSFVSTDGYRLALKTKTIQPLDRDLSVIIPFKAVNELNRIIQNEDNASIVNVNISENQIAFKKDSFLLISRVIQGQFPDYKQVIPQQSQSEYVVSRRALLAAAERASIIASSSNNVVRLSFEGNTLTIKANAPGLGEFKEEIEVNRTRGEGETKIAFNIRLVLDVIKTVDVDNIKMMFNNELSPCRVEENDNDDFVYIIMPIRTSEYQNE
jgi:DNA polymerase-3 subunit beta